MSITGPTDHTAALRLAERPGGRHPAPEKPKTPPAKPAKREKQPPQNETVVLLVDLLGSARMLLLDHGDRLWQRTVDWHRTGRVPPPSLADEGNPEAVSSQAAEDRMLDGLASRYQAELTALAHRLRSDLARLKQIDANVMRAQPRQIEGKDLVASQVAGHGLCVSCWRYDKTNKDRERDKDGAFYDKEACRRCAGFKREHGIYPPVSLLEHWHARGKNWTTTMVEQALTAAGHTKAKAS